MEKSEDELSWKEINRKDIVEYLSGLGIEPANDDKADEYWYHSPINPPDNTPSFKVNLFKNKWYDFSMGTGGSLIDLGIILHNCTVHQFRKKFGNLLGLPIHVPPRKAVMAEAESTSKNEIVSVDSLTSLPLLGYIASRGIPQEIANEFCKEVHYKNAKGVFYGIGFENDSGGFEIRSKYFKGGTIPKNVTHIYNGASQIAVFEGFFSFLSWLALNPGKDHDKMDYLILNSLTQFEKGRKIMETYDKINLFLDRDKSGIDKTAYAISLSTKYQDKSGFYEGYKDLNKFLTGEPIEETHALTAEHKRTRA